ncbi:MAG TPA: HD domain-containing protein [bacterium]
MAEIFKDKLPDIEDLKKHPSTAIYLESADKYLERIGYTEHGLRHAKLVSKNSKKILKELNYTDRICDLTEIAGFFHDVGNLLGRKNHGIAGALIVERLMMDCGFKIEEVVRVIAAIANHEDYEYDITDDITASLVIADKADVHRSRVRNPNFIKFDIHDRVNFAVTQSILEIDSRNKGISLILTIDISISKVVEYFEIFLSRMMQCKKAAEFLSCNFSIVMNNMKLL